MLHSFTSLRYVQGNSRLQKIKARVDAAKLAGKDEIGVRVGKIINQYKVAKHFELAIGADAFTFERKHEAIAEEACPRGCTHPPSAPDCGLVEAIAEGRLGDGGAARLDSLQRLLATFS